MEYREIATTASESAGPGTRKNINEFTRLRKMAMNPKWAVATEIVVQGTGSGGRLMGVRGRFACVVLLVCLPGLVGASEGAGLFSAHKEAAALLPHDRGLLDEAAGGAGELELRGGGPALGKAASSAELRSRVAEVYLGQLESARLGVEGRRQVRLGLNLFADAEFEAVFERSALTASGYTLTGRLADAPMSTVALTVSGEWVAGTIWSPHGRYVIRPLGGGVASVRQLDPSSLGRCGVEADSSEGLTGLSLSEPERPSLRHALDAVASDKSVPVSEAPPEDDGSLIDLLVVYPSFGRRSAGGYLAMRALIDSDVALANEAYRIGGAAQRLNLVAAVEARRTALENGKDGMSEALRHVSDPSSGYMDEVSELRDSYAADLVLVHWGHVIDGATAGVADLLESLEPPSAVEGTPLGYSVANSFAFAHELGHNMGLRHERANDPGNTPFPYSHGIQLLNPEGFLRFATIMASSGPHPVPRFSNPRQWHPDESGIRMGVPGDDPSDSADGPADAVRSLNGTRRLVANFRRSASRCSYELKTPANALPASGGEFRIRVQADSRCAWSAFSNNEFVSVADGSSGVGDGEVLFQVSANEGWERDVAVFVAGEAYLAEQATAKTRRETLVCDRAVPIRDALVEAVGKPCGEIGAEGLAAIRSLTLTHFRQSQSRRLVPGDFDGLTGLVSLDLRRMGLTGLAPGTFDGLIRLASLDLRYNQLEELAAGTFEGLPNLADLRLEDNRSLTTLKPGVFRGLSNIHELYFRGIGLTALAAGTFEGLRNLFRLDFDVTFDSGGAGCGRPGGECIRVIVPLTRVEPGAFRGLSKLDTLRLVGTLLTALQSGVFEGLPSLRKLSVSSNKGLTALEPGVFDGLPNLDDLSLINNNLKTLEPDIFDGLNLRSLQLWENELQSLPPGIFDGLGELEKLYLSENQLRSLETNVFDGLSKLWLLALGENELKKLPPNLFRGLSSLKRVFLGDNQLATLPPNLFRGLSSLDRVFLHDNQLTTLPPNLFGGQMPRMLALGLGGNLLGDLDPHLLRDLPNLKYLTLPDNRFAKLPPGLFEGLGSLRRLDLSGNPGAPFAFRPEFVRLPGGGAGSGRAVEFALEVVEGASFDMRIPLSATGGVLSAKEIVIRTGMVRGPAFSVAPRGDTPVILTATTPQPPSCGIEDFWSLDSTWCMLGLKKPGMVPLILYGLPDQALASDGAVRFDLPTAFPNFDEGASYAVESSDLAVAEATIREGLLIVSATGGGETTLTVTATGPDGLSATFAFTVTVAATVEQSIRSRWGSWRSTLLRPLSSESGDES